MATFQPLNYKIKLKNAQHFAFIQAFVSSLQAAGFTPAKLTTKTAELVAAFAVEDRYYMISRASEIIAQRTAADEKRDRGYGRLHRLVQAWEGSGIAQLDEAATELNKVFKLYKLNVHAQMDEETGVMDNLITDLSTQQMQAHLQTISGMPLFNLMVEGQNQVKSLRLEQGVEESEKVRGALVTARKACDVLYDEICGLIEAFALTADDATAYETFIRQWNGTVKLYQDMLDRKSGTTSSSSGGSGETGNTGDSGNSGNSGETGETGNSGTETGDNTGSDNTDGNTGDNTGSTGETPGNDSLPGDDNLPGGDNLPGNDELPSGE